MSMLHTSSTTAPLRVPSAGRLLLHLRDEWAVITTRPVVVRRIDSWSLPVRVTSVDELMRALGDRRAGVPPVVAAPDDGATGGAPTVEPDELLLSVVALARHDDLAGRVVLQRLLPGLLALARRWSRRCDGDPLDELVASAWIVIRTFPVERGHRNLAARMLGDCEYRTFLKQARRLLVQEPTPDVGADLASEAARTPLQELVELVGSAADLTDRDRRLLGLILSERSAAEMAAALAVSERSVRVHRASMVQRLRSAAA